MDHPFFSATNGANIFRHNDVPEISEREIKLLMYLKHVQKCICVYQRDHYEKDNSKKGIAKELFVTFFIAYQTYTMYIKSYIHVYIYIYIYI